MTTPKRHDRGKSQSSQNVRADLRAAFDQGAAGAPPTKAEGYWQTVGFIEPEDDVTEFIATEPETINLGEITHTPARSSGQSEHYRPELQEAPIIDAVIVDDDEAASP
jgi:hypothetical protein